MCKRLSISKGNTKMGSIASLSFPAYKSCAPNLPCYKLCYAAKISKLRKTVREAYERNWDLYQNEPETFWRELEAAVMTSRVFRFFVSGDLPNVEFFAKICEIMTKNPHCQAFEFTKRYSFVNEYIANGGVIPENLHIIFSGWQGLKMDNPYELPECHVIYKDGSTTAHDGKTFLCSNNCSDCFLCGKNCFNLKKGEQILIKQH